MIELDLKTAEDVALLKKLVARSEALIEQLAQKQERKLLKEVNLFDVYQGKNLAEGKKSYGVSFTFGDDDKTLTDVQIDDLRPELACYGRQHIHSPNIEIASRVTSEPGIG